MLNKSKLGWILLLGVAAWVRFYGTGFGLMLGQEGFLPLPLVRIDEELIWAVAARFFSGDLNPHFFIYPTLFPYFVAFLYLLYLPIKLYLFCGGSWEVLKQSVAVNPSDLILIARIAAASLGTFTVVWLYKIAAGLWTRSTAFLSALFLGLAYLHVRDSHFAVTDVPLTFMICLAYLFIIRVYQRGEWKDYTGSGLLMGLALSTKWAGLILVLPFLTAHFLRTRRFEELPKLGFSLLLIPAAFILGTPYAVISPSEFWRDVSNEIQIRSYPDWQGVRLGIGWIYHFKFTLWHGLGAPLFLAALIGMMTAFRKNWKHALLLLAFVLPYYLILGKQYLVFARYMVPLIPFLCLFAACGVVSLCEYVPGAYRKAVCTSLTALLLFSPVLRIIEFDRLLARKDSRILALDWIKQNSGKGQTTGVFTKFWNFPGMLAVENLQGLPDKVRFGWPPEFLQGYARQSQGLVFFLNAQQVIAHQNEISYLVVTHSPLLGRDMNGQVPGNIQKDWELVHTVQGLGQDPRMQFDLQDAFYAPFLGARFAARPGPDFYIFKNRNKP